MPTFNIHDFGATGDGQTNDGPAIQRAIDACHIAGGGTVLVPAGKRYLSGTLTLKSNVELNLERGSVIFGSGRWDDYTTRIAVGALSGGTLKEDQPASAMLIIARDAENIAITGGGVIDGNGQAYKVEDLGTIYRMKIERPFMFFLIGCKNVTFRDVTLRDSALWTLRLSGCRDVTIHSIHIDNDLRLPNNDGIDHEMPD